jgi:hypothetical protein
MAESGMEVPGEADIRKTARRLLGTAWDEGNVIATGGLEAKREEDTLGLRFVLEEWEIEE